MQKPLSAERPYVAVNDAERERLRSLVTGLSDEELRRGMPAGWTVAGVLAHIGFWDARILYLLDRWEGGTDPSEVDHEPEDVDWVNDSAKPLCLALPPRDAARLALRLAEETDRRVEALDEKMLAKIEAGGNPINLSRAEHRKEHLDEVEHALRRS